MSDLIVTHTNADFDAFASCVAAKKLYPDARICLPGAQEKSLREFMSLCKDIIKVETEKECHIDDIDRLIIVETRQASRIGKIQYLLKKKDGIQIHLYDHHPPSEGDIKADKDIYRNVGATVTILAGLLKEKDIGLSPLEATIMALGIYEDTGSLTFPGTTIEDVDTVSFLLSKGADLSVVSRYINRELTEDEIKVLVELLHSTETYSIKGVRVAIAHVRDAIRGIDLGLLTHKLLEVENFNLLFVLGEEKDKIQLIARSSLPYVDVGRISKAFGGGGHPTAGSAVIKGVQLQDVKERLIKTLESSIKPKVYARDIMTYPVKTVTSNQSAEEVKRIIMRLNISGMPVCDKGKLVGIVTGHDLDKAIYHGFGHSRVKGYMSINVVSVSLNTPLYEMQRIMFENNIGRLPVIKKGKLVGIITRTDVFRAVHYDLIKDTWTRPDGILRTEDVDEKMKNVLSKRVMEIFKLTGSLSGRMGYKVYAVGGLVRDILMGLENMDVDIVVEGDGIQLGKRLAQRLGGKITIHRRFGTATIILEDGFRIDLATARSEYYEYPAALPTVEFASIKHDLYRRDFTINSMAIILNKKKFGQLVDFFGGERDLQAKKIKVLHTLSFVDDPTRIFRAVRLGERYDFTINGETERLIKTAVDMEMFDKVQKERVRDEIILLLSEKYPLKGIRKMAELHELRFLHPKIKWNERLNRLLKSVEDSIYRLETNTLADGFSIEKWLIYLMALMDSLTFKGSKEVTARFIFKKEDEKRILSFKRSSHGVLKKLGARQTLKPSSIYKCLKGLSNEEIILIFAKLKSEKARGYVKDYLMKYKAVQLDITGNDLKDRLGLKPGPHFKRLLDKTLYAKLDGKIKTEEEELEFVRSVL